MKRLVSTLALAGALGLSACAEPLPPPLLPAQPEPVAAPADPLGPKPELPSPKTFEPPAPEVFKTKNGMTVWLLERHALPLVSATLAIPYGGSSDPQGKPGVAFMTADMLDEGAGKRSALELSTAVTDLGAQLGTGASMDGSSVSLAVLKKNFKQGFEILSDVVARPRFDAKEWKRVSSLWHNELKKRSQEPAAVARVAIAAALYGHDSPYGHPIDGLLSTANKVDLPSVKAFYSAHWRPDKATLVVAGDITRAELTAMIDVSLGSWTAPKKDAPPQPVVSLRDDAPRLVLVDRPDAPQSMIAVVREGVTAHDPSAPLLDLINTALGGSFSSRLNQDLREDHGWTYGARSTFTETRGRGSFYAGAAVVAEATGPALSAMLGDLSKMGQSGLTEPEFEKVKAQDRAEIVHVYEMLGGITRRLATLSILGLAPDYDAAASRKRQAATNADLGPLTDAVSPRHATIVVVGPRAAIEKQLESVGIGRPEIWDAEGSPMKAAPATKKTKK